jgi:hypothetical protein
MRSSLIPVVFDQFGYPKQQYQSKNKTVHNVNHDSDHWVITKGDKDWSINCSEKAILALYPPS